MTFNAVLCGICNKFEALAGVTFRLVGLLAERIRMDLCDKRHALFLSLYGFHCAVIHCVLLCLLLDTGQFMNALLNQILSLELLHLTLLQELLQHRYFLLSFLVT